MGVGEGITFFPQEINGVTPLGYFEQTYKVERLFPIDPRLKRNVSEAELQEYIYLYVSYFTFIGRIPAPLHIITPKPKFMC